jgi:hypothetical protein
MTPEQLKEVPRDLAVMQYAAWLCENCLGLPAARSNLEVVSQAIEAISKAKFNTWRRPIFTSFIWLERQCELAKKAGIVTNHLFFLNGEYLNVSSSSGEKLYPMPSKEELAAHAKWMKTKEYEEIRKTWLALDAKMNMNRVMK